MKHASLSTQTAHYILCALFFCSGCATLIYQLMWQHLLWKILGLNMVTVVLVLSVFMFGLGAGALFGGFLADKMPSRLLALYLAFQVYIALFGYFSSEVIAFVGEALSDGSMMQHVMVCYLILAIPTLLMGATFPILVTHVNRYKQSMRASVGDLSLVSFLGSALGAYLSGFVLLASMEVVGAIHCAVLLNVMVVLMALLMFRRRH